MHIFNLYAPNDIHERTQFFQSLDELFLEGNIMLLGDFNSVVTPSDHLSQQLDTTSSQLCQILNAHNFIEPPGSHLHIFTYHHPAVPSRESHLDHIYVNFVVPHLHGFTLHTAFSDHYAFGLFLNKKTDKGPYPW